MKKKEELVLTLQNVLELLTQLSGRLVGFIKSDHFKFLAWKVYHDLAETNQKERIEELFDKYMDLTDKSFVHGFMKLWLYQHYVLAYLTWEMMIYDLDITWIRSIEKKATFFLKKWAGI